MQSLQTRLTSAISEARKSFAGSAVTDSEMKALENLIGLNQTWKAENLRAALLQIMKKSLVEFNSAREVVDLPPIIDDGNVDTVNDRSSLYFSE